MTIQQRFAARDLQSPTRGYMNQKTMKYLIRAVVNGVPVEGRIRWFEATDMLAAFWDARRTFRTEELVLVEVDYR